MRRSHFYRWLAGLALAITLAPSLATAQETDTLSISSTFNMDWLDGTVGPDLAAVYGNGYEHTCTLTLHGTTQSHHSSGSYYVTEIHATSFDLEFFGPNAATLNSIVSDHMAGGEVRIELWNNWGGGFALWQVAVFGLDVEFETGALDGWIPLFPSDADGYPVVGPDPLSIRAEYSYLYDRRSGNDGYIWSGESLVTFQGSVGEPEPGVLAVADASVLEGNRGTSKVAVAVTLSSGSSQPITVHYATANGTALAKSDYTATSGTLTFQPGETSRTISVAIKGDLKREANETFSVEISNAVGAALADGVATVTILNDD